MYYSLDLKHVRGFFALEPAIGSFAKGATDTITAQMKQYGLEVGDVFKDDLSCIGKVKEIYQKLKLFLEKKLEVRKGNLEKIFLSGEEYDHVSSDIAQLNSNIGRINKDYSIITNNKISKTSLSLSIKANQILFGMQKHSSPSTKNEGSNIPVRQRSSSNPFLQSEFSRKYSSLLDSISLAPTATKEPQEPSKTEESKAASVKNIAVTKSESEIVKPEKKELSKKKVIQARFQTAFKKARRKGLFPNALTTFGAFFFAAGTALSFAGIVLVPLLLTGLIIAAISLPTIFGGVVWSLLQKRRPA